MRQLNRSTELRFVNPNIHRFVFLSSKSKRRHLGCFDANSETSFLLFFNLLKKLFRHLYYQGSCAPVDPSVCVLGSGDGHAAMTRCQDESYPGIIMLAGLITCGHPGFAFPAHIFRYVPTLASTLSRIFPVDCNSHCVTLAMSNTFNFQLLGRL